jgi:hypothetical protein
LLSKQDAAADWISDGHRPQRLWERGQLAAALADTGARLQASSRAHRDTSNGRVVWSGPFGGPGPH